MTSSSQQPTIRLSGLGFLNLMHRVPEHDLGNIHALVIHALRAELTGAGYASKSIQLGAMRSFVETEEGRTALVDLLIDGRPETAEVAVPSSELGAVFHHRVVVEDFAERALELARQPHESALVGSIEPRTDSRVELRLVDNRTGTVVWYAAPLSTCPEVFDAV